jgi:hypothetical protein
LPIFPPKNTLYLDAAGFPSLSIIRLNLGVLAAWAAAVLDMGATRRWEHGSFATLWMPVVGSMRPLRYPSKQHLATFSVSKVANRM